MKWFATLLRVGGNNTLEAEPTLLTSSEQSNALLSTEEKRARHREVCRRYYARHRERELMPIIQSVLRNGIANGVKRILAEQQLCKGNVRPGSTMPHHLGLIEMISSQSMQKLRPAASMWTMSFHLNIQKYAGSMFRGICNF